MGEGGLLARRLQAGVGDIGGGLPRLRLHRTGRALLVQPLEADRVRLRDAGLGFRLHHRLVGRRPLLGARPFDGGGELCLRRAQRLSSLLHSAA